MGGVVKKVTKAVGKVFGLDPSKEAAAIREAADRQAAATRAAAEKQEQATRAAAAAQVQTVQSQSAANAAAQAANINQAALAAQLAEEHAAQAPTDTTPDITSPDSSDTEDTRRRYRSGTGNSSLGGTASGVGIRL